MAHDISSDSAAVDTVSEVAKAIATARKPRRRKDGVSVEAAGAKSSAEIAAEIVAAAAAPAPADEQAKITSRIADAADALASDVRIPHVAPAKPHLAQGASAAHRALALWHGAHVPRKAPSRFARVALAATIGLFGIGLASLIGSRLGSDAQTAFSAAEDSHLPALAPWKQDIATGLLQSQEIARLRNDLRNMRASVDSIRANADNARLMQDAKALKVLVEGQRAELASQNAQLAGRLDKIERDTDSKLGRTSERMDRVERQLADPTPIGTSAKPVAAKAAPGLPATKPDVSPAGPSGYLLRGVQDGVALIQTRRGTIEVEQGDIIPGIGRVQAIERRGGRWTVVTTTGVIDDTRE